MNRRMMTPVLALVVVGSGTLAACGSADPSSETGGGLLTEEEMTSLAVCSDTEYEPMEFEDPDNPGTYIGFDMDLLRAVVKPANMTIDVNVTSFNAIFAALDAKNCDVVASSVTITDDRDEKMDFSDPYFTADQSLMVRVADGNTYTALEDLTNAIIGVQEGTSGEQYVNDNTPDGATIQALPTAPDLFAALESEKIDAVFQDFPVNAFRTTQDDRFVVTKKIPTDEQYGFAVRTNDSKTLKILNDGLQAVQDDGTYDALYEEYFNEAPTR